MSLTVFWYRRDLRLEDNVGLYEALKRSGASVQPLFIFDQDILGRLEDSRDARVVFLHRTVRSLKEKFQELGSDLLVHHGKPETVIRRLLDEHKIEALYTNHDYEPAARTRDKRVRELCESRGVEFQSFKDQVVFEKDEILTDSRKAYTVYTPYKKKWLAGLSPFYLRTATPDFAQLRKCRTRQPLVTLQEIGFQDFDFPYFPKPDLHRSLLESYAEKRDFPSLDATTHLGLHLRFGTVSVRALVAKAQKLSPTWLSELIWREFFMQILYHFPKVEKESFRPEYEKVAWRKSRLDFERWSQGMTGYPIVDAGMRELNTTGYMHNRVRMITASFLTKHLLMHWLKGERYFASKLLDYDLAANNGNWQWAAGTGCDAAPYFRIFNPQTQTEKFDPDLKYIRKWVPELGTSKYPSPMIDHREARDRALRAFHLALKGKSK